MNVRAGVGRPYPSWLKFLESFPSLPSFHQPGSVCTARNKPTLIHFSCISRSRSYATRFTHTYSVARARPCTREISSSSPASSSSPFHSHSAPQSLSYWCSSTPYTLHCPARAATQPTNPKHTHTHTHKHKHTHTHTHHTHNTNGSFLTQINF